MFHEKIKKLSLSKIKKIAYKSPFGMTPKGITFAISSQISSSNICDYGCNDGKFLCEISKLKSHKQYLGLDLDADVLRKARNNYSQSSIKWILVEKGKNIPLESNSVDVLTMTEVLEHIYDKKFIINEIYRILSPNGIAILTVPGKHLFSCLDMGNFKFVFPNIHKFFYIFFKGKEKYNYRYVNNPYGLIGDIEKEAGWHEHFSFDSFHKLVSASNFKILKSGGIGYFFRILININFFLPRPLKRLFKNFIDLDSFLFSKAQIFFILTKK